MAAVAPHVMKTPKNTPQADLRPNRGVSEYETRLNTATNVQYGRVNVAIRAGRRTSDCRSAGVGARPSSSHPRSEQKASRARRQHNGAKPAIQKLAPGMSMARFSSRDRAAISVGRPLRAPP